jgi:hypothetical protein
LESALAKPEEPVAVSEDMLYKATITLMQMEPIYWEGPIYEIKRATWFISSSTGFIPCELSLADQLEEGYLKVKPWTKIKGNEFKKSNEALEPKVEYV